MPRTAFIFARGGSKGVPEKNIRILAGKPLIAWSIEAALASKYIERVVVSTDSSKIAKISEQFGAIAPFIRSKKLSTDNASEILAWRDALEKMSELEGIMPDTFISVPATSPLRLPKDLDACIEKFINGKADVVFAVTKAQRNPWFNMVKRCPNQGFSLVNSNGLKNNISRRQDAPEIFDMTTIAYISRSQYVLHNDNLFNGLVSTIEVPPERAVDIDTIHDFKLAEFLLSQRLEEK